MLLSHYRAGTGAVAVETREEQRLIASALAELPATAEVAVIAAPAGVLRAVRLADGRVVTDREPIRLTQGVPPIFAAYQWAAGAPGRVLVVLDWHVLSNSPGHWRSVLEALPGLRSQAGQASLIVFVAPALKLEAINPVKGLLPILAFEPPDRAAIRAVCESLATMPGGEEGEAVIDSLCGLSSDAAEQAAAECLAGNRGQWVTEHLRGARKQTLREGGLEIWDSVADLGGLGGLKRHVTDEVTPWLRHPTLAIRRLLLAGVPGVGKSYFARWLAGQLGCECARVSIPALKAGLVGQSEGNLRRCLATIDAMAKQSPLVVVLDEIDTIARDGMDGGTSSGMFSELLTWLQESQSLAVVVATLNRLDKLDAALESRFQSRFFIDLPTLDERRSVAAMHYARHGCDLDMVSLTADITEGFSSREIAETVVPSVARLSHLEPTAAIVNRVVAATTPASRTQAAQLESMRAAAATLRRGNDQSEASLAGGRNVSF